MNPYIHEGARVRVVNHDNCPWIILNGEEYVVEAVSNCGKFIQARGGNWFAAGRFKPIVRKPAGRCRVASFGFCAQTPCKIPCTTRVCINGQWYGNLNGTPRGPDVPPDAKPGDVVYNRDRTRYANVFLGSGGLYLSPWWAMP